MEDAFEHLWVNNPQPTEQQNNYPPDDYPAYETNLEEPGLFDRFQDYIAERMRPDPIELQDFADQEGPENEYRHQEEYSYNDPRDAGERELISEMNPKAVATFKEIYGFIPPNRRTIQMAIEDPNNAEYDFGENYYKPSFLKSVTSWFGRLKQVIDDDNIIQNVKDAINEHGSKIALGLVISALLSIGTYAAGKAVEYVYRKPIRDAIERRKTPQLPATEPIPQPASEPIPQPVQPIPEEAHLPPQQQSLPMAKITPASPIQPKLEEINLPPQMQSMPVVLAPGEIPTLRGNDLKLFGQIMEKDLHRGIDHSKYIRQKIELMLKMKLKRNKSWEPYNININRTNRQGY